LVYLPAAFLFSYNIAFTYPGVLLFCLWRAWGSEQRRRVVAATLASGAVCLVTSIGIYRLALTEVIQEDRTENYWGRKYDVFYHPKEKASRVDWTLERTTDMLAFAGLRRETWTQSPRLSERTARELGSADRLLWAGLSLAGLVTLWRRRRAQLLLLAMPLLVVLAANALGKWPLGSFRTNIFTTAYVIPLPVMGLEALIALGVTARVTLGALVMALTVLPGFLFGFDWHGHKRTYTRDHYHRQVLEKLHAYRQKQLKDDPELGPARLMMDAHTYHPHGYYLKDHPVYGPRYQAYFKRNFNQENIARGSLGPRIQQRLAKDNQPIWVVLSKPNIMAEVDEYAKKSTKVLVREEVAGQHLILLLGKR
jgi:hypothetical protein